eukprot:5262706-Ditylum_brightwellii.AAC.1
MASVSGVAPAAPSYEAPPPVSSSSYEAAPVAPASSGPPKSYSPFGQKHKASAPQNAYMASVSGVAPAAPSYEAPPP